MCTAARNTTEKCFTKERYLKDQEIQRKNAELQRNYGEIQRKDNEIQSKDSEIQRKNTEIQHLTTALHDKDVTLETLRSDMSKLQVTTPHLPPKQVV